MSTLVDGQGLNMTVQSYNGNLDFGFVADRELVPDLWVMTELLHDEMRELRALAAPAAPAAGSTAKRTRRR